MICKECYLAANCKKEGTYIEEDSMCVRYYKLNYLFDNSLLPLNQRLPKSLVLDENKCDEKVFEELVDIKKNIVKFVNEGQNLYICSSTTGNGKTSWAIKLLQQYLLKIWPEAKLECKVLYIPVSKFLIELKNNISKSSEYIEFINNNVLNADIVLWDDIGTKGATEFEHEHLLSLIDSRMINNKSNIFTSNIEPNDLGNQLGQRLASRIINGSIVKRFIGKDKRNLDVVGGID